MPFDPPTLPELQKRILRDFENWFNPEYGSVRHSMVKALAMMSAGEYYQLYGNLAYLARQIFPDTADGEFLRAHWADRVPPATASFAAGEAMITGLPGATMPEGAELVSTSGRKYLTSAAVSIGKSGTATIHLKAVEAGQKWNTAPYAKLRISSTLPAGVDPQILVDDKGVGGGKDSESDEDYRTRILTYLRQGVRYGKKGDWAAWALDSSAEVTMAWETPHGDSTGALIIHVLGGSQLTQVQEIKNVETVINHIAQVAPPVPWNVHVPELEPVDLVVALPPETNIKDNQRQIEVAIKKWLQQHARPGKKLQSSDIEEAIEHGAGIADAAVTMSINPKEKGDIQLARNTYPIVREVSYRHG